MPHPIRRPTARVLPVDDTGEVLLLTIQAADGRPGLMTIGGGIEPGESERRAATRELAEEIGWTAEPDDLVGPIHHGTHEWRDVLGHDYVSESTFFALPVVGRDNLEVTFTGQRPDELGFIIGHEWVAPGALFDDARVRHPHLPHIAGIAAARVRGEEYVVHRRTARVLPVNGRDEVLLVHSHDPESPDRPYWCSLGGGLDDGETPPHAAVRELLEESGLAVDPGDLRGPFDRTEVRFPYAGATFANDSTWFAVALEADPASLRNHDPSEAITGYRWWRPADLAADLGHSNPDLPRVMAAAVLHLRESS
ncbi:MAG: NUDIX domain-containing protein [Nocardioides sp.]